MTDMRNLHRGFRVPRKEQVELLSPLIFKVADLLETDIDRGKIRSVIQNAVDDLNDL